MKSLGIFSAVVLFLLFMIQSFDCFPQQNQSLRKGDLNEFQFLGEVEGRKYYADANSSMTWNNAKAHCQQMGLELATIATRNQAEFLRDSLYLHFKSAVFWSAGHEDPSELGYLWDNTTNKLHASEVGFTWTDSIGSGNVHCVWVKATNTTLGLGGDKCHYAARALCQE